MVKVGIITGSTRPNRKSLDVAKWVLEIARKRSDAEYELVDGEVDRDTDARKHRVVRAPDRRPAGRRREARGHEHAVLGVELFDPGGVSGVQGRFVAGQQRA